MRISATALGALLTLLIASSFAQERKTPKRPDEPFRIHVKATPESNEEQIEEARRELEKRLGKNKNWFQLAPTGETAEILVDLRAYWTRDERRYLSTWGVVPPTEGGQPDKTQMIEIVTYHSIRGQVTFFGIQRTVEASKKKNAKGRAKDAVKNFASELERICKDEYWQLMGRRKAMPKSS